MTKLKPCKDCETPISTRAKICPHCGLKKPHEPDFIRYVNYIAGSLMGLGFLLFFLLAMLGMCAA